MVIMMNKRILTIISIFAIGMLVVVTGFFLLDIEKVAINFWAFGSLMFSLVVSLFATIFLIYPGKNKYNVLHTVGLSNAVWVYEIIIIISILFLKPFIDHLGGFIFLQISINALFLVAMITIKTASGRVHNVNVNTYENLQVEEYNKPKRGGF